MGYILPFPPPIPPKELRIQLLRKATKMTIKQSVIKAVRKEQSAAGDQKTSLSKSNYESFMDEKTFAISKISTLYQ